MLYIQRLFDAGTGNWVYYSKPMIDTVPAATETTPNYTGAISSHSVVAVDTSEEGTTEIFLDFISDESFLLDDTNSTGTGAVALVEADHAKAAEGHGVLELDTGAAAGLALTEHGVGGTPIYMFRGSLRTVAELRVNFPATPGDVTFVWGFDNAGTPSSCKVTYAEGSPLWAFVIESDDGGNNDADATAVSATAGWHTLRLEWDPGIEARFYVDDVLVSTLTGTAGDAVPAADDAMTVFISAATAGATAGAIYVDWMRIISERT